MATSTRAAGETKTFKLSVPIVHDGKTIEQITMREPEVGDVIAAEKFKGQAEQTVALFASVSGLTVGAISRMKLRDFKQIERWITPFIAESSSVTEDGAT